MTIPASNHEGVSIRRAERADLLEVVRIERASFEQPWPLEAFEGFLGQSGFLVAEERRSVVGYVVSDIDGGYGGAMGHVKDIAVRPDRRGRGLGSRLLERALGVLVSEGARRVKLEVRETNERAISLYEDYGFSVHHRVPDYYEDGEDALVCVADVER